MDTVYRLLGPSHNRLVTVLDAEKHQPGQVSHKVAEALKVAGWQEYKGTATTKAGWVVKDTDPALHPHVLKR